MEARRQRHAYPERNLGFIANVHELAVRGIIHSVVDGWIHRHRPEPLRADPDPHLARSIWAATPSSTRSSPKANSSSGVVVLEDPGRDRAASAG